MGPSDNVDLLIEEATKLYASLVPLTPSPKVPLALSLFLVALLVASNPSPLLAEEFNDRGFIKCIEGEGAENQENMRRAYNEALSFYLARVDGAPSGKLCYNIAHCYALLGENGAAAYYYYLALAELPREKYIWDSLKLALEASGAASLEPRNFGFLGVPFYYFSEYEVRLLFLATLSALFIFASLYLWTRIFFFRFLRSLLFVVAGMLVLSLVWKNFLVAKEGVLLRPCPIFAAADSASIRLTGKPVFAGTKVTILRVEKKGWFFVRLPTGLEGYIPPEQASLLP
jgi:hypothetical protein